MQKPSLPKGTRDFGPAQMKKRRYLLHTIEQVYLTYGFAQIETPAMEQLSTLTGKYGDEGDKLLFRILNSGDFLNGSKDEQRKDSQQLISHIAEKGLRYDLTVPFARFVVMNRNALSFPFRRYQMQPVWRADRPQKGRYREFWQCDADIIGTDSLLSECDLIGIYRDVFSALGIASKVMINHRKVLEGIAELSGVSQHFRTFTVIIDKLDKIGWEGIGPELMQLGISESGIYRLREMMQERSFSETALNELEQLISRSEIGLQGIAELKTLMGYVRASGNEMPLHLNLSLARGIDYYTGCIFEAIPTKVKMGSISGGGRYDNLTGVFGLSGMSGVGISFGIDRIYDVLEELGAWPEEHFTGTRVLICYFSETGLNHAIGLASHLRLAGIETEVYPELKKLGKQLDYANKKEIPYALIAGEEEISKAVYGLKNLKEGTQTQHTLQEIIQHLV